ncbi:response regulator [Chryseolinea lacunae]|uniref:Response regulator n=1 Tax=Chryseolinea lacunae TaxID=2801331 RepID=A0ABS1KXK4_9BACT|nr:response regulator [Chryseolinea lacunae]MBL0744191.1 response regulator [Chryseolinea lacunae]
MSYKDTQQTEYPAPATNRKNGEDALYMLQEEPAAKMPDLILLDLNMPKMNGFELLSLIRENDHWKDIKVFIQTTSDQSEDKTLAQTLGISGFITKPLKLDSLSSMDAFNLMMDLMNM